MTSSVRPKVAFFDFTSCEGCQLTVIDALQTHPELLDVVDIVEFREAMSEKSDSYDIAFIEGSCSRSSDEDRLRDIRQRAGIVVALGACAHLGGVNAIRNRQNLEEVRQYVYGGYADWFDAYEARAIKLYCKDASQNLPTIRYVLNVSLTRTCACSSAARYALAQSPVLDVMQFAQLMAWAAMDAAV
jgi:coenzyme F420-reducing hydrogenase gamma subunit